MFCIQCGKEMGEDEAFCTQCGAPISESGKAGAKELESDGRGNGPSASKKGPIIAIASIVIVAVVAVLAYMILSGSFPAQQAAEQQEAAEAPEKAELETTEVPVSFTGAGYAPSVSTPIWLNISGTDDNGEPYQQGFAIDGSSMITLPLGSYEASPAASPLSGDGALFSVTPKVISFAVSATGSSHPLSWTLAPIGSADITDEQLTAAVAGAESAGVPATEITSFYEKVTAARTQAKEAAKADAARAEDASSATVDNNFDGSSSSRGFVYPSGPFWGVWVGSFRTPENAEAYVREWEDTVPLGIVKTDRWTNLNAEPWYAVTTGFYESESQANRALETVGRTVHESAYVKYSGQYKNS